MSEFDRFLFLCMNASADTPAPVVFLAHAASDGLPWAAACALAVALLQGGARARRTVLLCAAGLALAWCMVHAIRWALPMPRPAQLGMGMQWAAQGLRPSFPSMHASGAFAVAMWASLYAPRALAWAAWAGALLVAWSRLCLGLHFPSDLLAGLVVGAGSALLVALAARAARYPAAALAVSAPGRS
mgnify:CR=1 FL=1